MDDSSGRDPRSNTTKRSGTIANNLAAVVQERPRWVTVAARLVGDREAADDILQIAFVRALTRASTVRDPDRFVSWFRRVLANTAVDHTRRVETYERALQRFATEASTLEPELEKGAAACKCVYLALLDLRSTDGEIIRKVDLDGCSLEELARAEGLTATNARVRLHRARRALRSRLAAMCGGSPLERRVPCTCDLESLCRLELSSRPQRARAL
jgi:RNA polymerase sigma-70 factor (ECF subfamily)